MESRRPPIRKPSPLLDVAAHSLDALAWATMADDARIVLEAPEGSGVLDALRERVHTLEQRLGAAVVLVSYEGARGEGAKAVELVPARAAPDYAPSFGGYRDHYCYGRDEYDSEREYDSMSSDYDDY